MVGFYNYTVYLTYFGLISSFVGMYYAFNGDIRSAVICLLVSGMCDMFDGKIARTKKDRTDDEKRFGIQIDSLCDVVCFGVFPAFLGIALGIDKWWQVAVAAVFTVCGVIRLAYYNVTEETRQQTTSENRKEYLGIPITSSAIFVPVLMCFRNMIGMNFSHIYSGMLAVLAAGFISPLHIHKPGKVLTVVFILIGLGIVGCLFLL